MRVLGIDGALQGELASFLGRVLGLDGALGERAVLVVGDARVVLELVAREDHADVGVQVELACLAAGNPASQTQAHPYYA